MVELLNQGGFLPWYGLPSLQRKRFWLAELLVQVAVGLYDTFTIERVASRTTGA